MRDESAAYTPTDYILLNCGASSSSDSVSEEGRKWITDEGSKFSIFSKNTSFASTASRQDQSITRTPYMTARVFHETFTYSFPVSPGLKFLRLYFYPFQYSGFDGSTSFFYVTANDHLLLQNFIAYLTLSSEDNQGASLIKEFMVPCFETEKLNVTFWPSPNSLAFVNGIEAVSMPKNLYVKHQDNSISFVNSKIPFDIPDATAFETVYSLNVGQATAANVNDTRMFRTWLDDTPYIFGGARGITPTRSNVTIKYSKDTPAYTAPAVVYTQSRTMGRDPYINMNYNLTWNFDIDGGFNYLLRLHFCETLLEFTEAGQRVFDIFINNRTAQKDADVIYWSGGQNKQILWLALDPARSQFVDAILHGLQIFRLNKSDGSLAVPNPQPSSSHASRKPGNKQPKKGKENLLPMKTIIGATPGCTATVLLCLLLSMIFWRKKRHSFSIRKSKERRKASPLPDQLCQCFTLAEIQAVTNDFDDAFVIERGGFGNVYKGFISRIKSEVAIKRLNSLSQQGAREFWIEIQLLSQLRYVNLVSLIGYCNDNNEMILIYEYMANGTLRDHLYNTKRNPLSWKQRLKICIDAARGLDYLHSGAIHRIIHRDVKSTNILLDEQYVAKISNFGLSKMSPISMTNFPLTTVVKGTFGYMDPEYYKRVRLTEKSDVYSFGVVLFEVLFTRLAVDSKVEYSQISLADWGRKCVANESINESIDPFLKENCIRENGCETRSMNDVANRLELALQMQEIEDVEQNCQVSDGAQSQVNQDI
ncbi:hypothetical protein GOBAR_AA02860 [Gossypium barbadense]|uniref:non-specific serine/threonine protein kinase n=1 Tax=Gossypium barbadense TaxID=3634 RepID=A0A2P5YQ43_GOSBA|nr:hypothetical protein GOBAR_AA02860 [Gossypium barbadense]